MYDYARMSTNKLEALKLRKIKEIRSIDKKEWKSRRLVDRQNNLMFQLRIINAVLTARQNTLRMEGF